MILEVIIIILILIVAVLIFATINLLYKLEKTEDSMVDYDNYITELTKQIEYSTLQLKKIDEKGTFEGDDEIGWFFKHILEIQNKLEKFKIK
jgi:HAMP domain-containing protein